MENVQLNSLSIILPAFNEEPNVKTAIEKFSSVMYKSNLDYEIILVNDGSRDHTGDAAKSLLGVIPHLRVIEHYPNRGYGGALKAGFDAATKEWVAFAPSDNQFDANEVRLLIDKSNSASIVTGYRANDADPMMRRINRWGWNLVVRIMFGYMARDIDCGFKLFKRDILKYVTIYSNGAMIDTELLAGASARGYRIAEVPLTHLPRTAGHPTGANIRVILRAFRDLVRFRFRLWREMSSERAAARLAHEKQR